MSEINKGNRDVSLLEDYIYNNGNIKLTVDSFTNEEEFIISESWSINPIKGVYIHQLKLLGYMVIELVSLVQIFHPYKIITEGLVHGR